MDVVFFAVSIPFIAGQWSLQRLRNIVEKDPALFQSPSLRGSGRFGTPSPPEGGAIRLRFNPLHCGAVVASKRHAERAAPVYEFQSPSLRGSGRFQNR